MKVYAEFSGVPEEDGGVYARPVGCGMPGFGCPPDESCAFAGATYDRETGELDTTIYVVDTNGQRVELGSLSLDSAPLSGKSPEWLITATTLKNAQAKTGGVCLRTLVEKAE